MKSFPLEACLARTFVDRDSGRVCFWDNIDGVTGDEMVCGGTLPDLEADRRAMQLSEQAKAQAESRKVLQAYARAYRLLQQQQQQPLQTSLERPPPSSFRSEEERSSSMTQSERKLRSGA